MVTNKSLHIVCTIVLMLVGIGTQAKTPIIKDGILDLRNLNYEDYHELEFTGNWEFYWNQLLEPADFADTTKNLKPHYIKVPSFWNRAIINDKELPASGFATYRLRILTKGDIKPLGLKLGSIGTANRIYADGNLISKAGVVATNKEEAKPGYKTGVYAFTPTSNEFDLVIQVSNYHYARSGIWNNINRLGTLKSIRNSWDRKMDITLILLGCFLIICLYHIGLYSLNKDFLSALYFSLFCLILIIRTVVMSEVYLLTLFPDFNWHAHVKIEYLTMVVGVPVFSYFVYHVFTENYSKKMLHAFLYLSTTSALFIVFTSTIFFTKYLYIFQLPILITVFYSFYVAIKSINSHGLTTLIFLMGFIVLAFAVINDILYAAKVINTIYLAPFGFMFFVLSQAYLLSYKYSSMYKYNLSLSRDLELINLNLEKTVEQRTEKIHDQNKALFNQKEEIKSQNQILEQQNEEIKSQRDNLEKQNALVTQQKQHITSSIQYARKIQDALLSIKSEIKTVAPNSFVLFQPKDIVSGDFYWFKNLSINGKDYKLFTAVDCTGHGVPGAFMSMLGTSYLNEIVANLNEPTSAASILNLMRQEVKKSLQQGSNEESVRDGMDMALCMLDYENKCIQFAGAYNPLFIIRKNGESYKKEIEEYKGDRMPIGIHYREKDYFTNHIIDFNPDDLLYVFTDGYIDQFGGSETKKVKYKSSRFKELLIQHANRSMEEQKEILETELNTWMGDDTPQIDDITVIGVKL